MGLRADFDEVVDRLLVTAIRIGVCVADWDEPRAEAAVIVLHILAGVKPAEMMRSVFAVSERGSAADAHCGDEHDGGRRRGDGVAEVLGDVDGESWHVSWFGRAAALCVPGRYPRRPNPDVGKVTSASLNRPALQPR